MSVPGWYHRLSLFFKNKFGERVTKIPLDLGLTCPNRDGTLSKEGCIYCYNPAFSPAAAMGEQRTHPRAVKQQIRKFQWLVESKRGSMTSDHTEPPLHFVPAKKYIAYFQTYSNTYGPLELLEKLYNEALQAPGVVGLSVATRPDCMRAEALELLTSLARDNHIWLELGLQSVHDRTLKLINRGHTFGCFQEVAYTCRDRNLKLCVHLINGLPGEDAGDMLETAKLVAALPVHGIKFHQLQVIKGTRLEQLYRDAAFSPLTLAQYLEIICNQLEVLPPHFVVHRLLAETMNRELLLAPDWHVPRAQFANMVEGELRRRGTYQGSRIKNP